MLLNWVDKPVIAFSVSPITEHIEEVVMTNIKVPVSEVVSKATTAIPYDHADAATQFLRTRSEFYVPSAHHQYMHSPFDIWAWVYHKINRMPKPVDIWLYTYAY